MAKNDAEIDRLNQQLAEFYSNVTPKQRAHLKDWKNVEKSYELRGYLPDEAKVKADELVGPEWPEPLSSNFIDQNKLKDWPRAATQP